MEKHKSDELHVGYIYCLSLDLIGSTRFGMQLTTRELDTFNLQLVRQIQPHLASLGLAQAIIKFTGDGWLLMTEDVRKVPGLCCLGVILSQRFQEEMSFSTGIGKDRIPPVRVTICSGRDIMVELPDGRKDWVGDSARRATRASQLCMPNQVIIDETVRLHVFRDFVITPLDVAEGSTKHRPEKWEEDFQLHILGRIKLQVVAQTEAASCFVYTLGQLGMLAEATTTARKAADHLVELSSKMDVTGKIEVQRNLASWNKLIASLPNYESKVGMLESMKASKLAPDVVTYNNLMHNAPSYDIARSWLEIIQMQGVGANAVTYNTLMDKSPDYEAAKECLEAMKSQGIQPGLVTYNTLISKAPDYEAAKEWLEIMKSQGFWPSVVTYNTLIRKAPDYEAAKEWLEVMKYQGIQPDVVTYNTLINKALDYEAAKEWLEVMKSQAIWPSVITYNTLIHKAPDYEAAKEWLEVMKSQGIWPSFVTYNTLIRKAPDYEAAKECLEAMKSQGIKPDAVTYNTLINKAPDYKAAKEWREIMKSQGI